MKKKIVVSEAVAWGHPDKIADQISDALLDAYLEKDPNSLTGIEVLIKNSTVVVGGEVKSNAQIDVEDVVKTTISRIPFSPIHNLDYSDIKVLNLIGHQSNEINKGVEHIDGTFGAGDQGFMVGYATNETPTYLPLGVHIAKEICKNLVDIDSKNFGPDCKSQVVVEYSEDGSAKVTSILVSVMNRFNLDITRNYVKKFILTNIMGVDKNVFDTYIRSNPDLKIDVNPCGEWKIGGPVSDCGVTGRKIVVDQYGGYSNVGGGCFSGKDGQTKVDRSGAYMARFLAKNIVAAGLADECKVELSYMIGIAQPSSINVVGCEDSDAIIRYIYENVDLTPKGISDRFSLREPIYYKTARCGHFGNSEYEWEKITNIFDDFKKI